MLFAYIDESGDIGYKGSNLYILAALVIPQDIWDEFHEEAQKFVRKVIESYNIRSSETDEIHHKEFRNGSKGWQKTKLKDYYIDLSRFINKFKDIYIFSILIDKIKIQNKTTNPLPFTAIKFLSERLAGLSYYLKDQILIIVDNSSKGLHHIWREAIRNFKKQGTNMNQPMLFKRAIVEEALFVDSKTSPEIQIADSIAGFTLEFYKKPNEYINFQNDFPFFTRKDKLIGWGLKFWPE